MGIATLKKRSEFQRVRGGGRYSSGAFVLEGKARAESSGSKVPARFGFTVTKKLGGAVQRNRIRRRLKAAIAEIAEQSADPRFDYVVVARDRALDLPFSTLRTEMAAAFLRVHAIGKPGRVSPERQKPADKTASRKL